MQQLHTLAATLNDAAAKAPFFPAGLRDNLTAAAEFCALAAVQIETQADKIAALEAERDKDNAAQAGFIDSLGELAGRIESQAETAAALLAHVGDLTAKVQALEAAKPAA